MADGVAEVAEGKEERPLPDADTAREWLDHARAIPGEGRPRPEDALGIDAPEGGR